MGGCHSGGGGAETKTFKFQGAGGSGNENNSTPIPAAVANVKIKSKTFEGALAEFKRNHLLANREFAYEVDRDGYVSQYVKGARSSVGIASTRNTKESMIIHNHPSGGAFSDADLLSTALDGRAKGIVASGKNYDYIFEKGTHFKADKFTKAVRRATLKGTSYDNAVDNWLTANQKKYGYKYKRTKN